MKKIDIDWKRLHKSLGWMSRESERFDFFRSVYAIENSIRRQRFLANKSFFERYAASAENKEVSFICVDEYIHGGFQVIRQYGTVKPAGKPKGGKK